MIVLTTKFKYDKSYKIIQWGLSFDSMLELKFAISIQDEYAFLRERIVIYYHNGALKPTNYIREGVLRYTPDFLMRNRETGEAYLIEIKPRAAQHEPQLQLRKAVAENYIKWKNYDWKYKVVFDDEIILNEEMLRIFQDCRKLKSKSAFKLWLQQQNHRYGHSASTGFARLPRETDIQFICLEVYIRKADHKN